MENKQSRVQENNPLWLIKKKRETVGGLESIMYLFYISVLVLFNVLPVFKYSVTYQVSGSLSLLIFLLIFLGNVRQRNHITVILICAFGLAAIFYLVTYPLDNIAAINEFIAVVRLFSPSVIFIFMVQKLPRYVSKVVFLCFTVVLVLVLVKTFVQFSVDPEVARNLASGDRNEYLTTLRSKNIGGFGFCYSIGLIMPFLLNVFLKTKHFILKLLIFAVLVFCFLFVFETQYFELFILTVVSISVVLLYRMPNKELKLVVIILGAVALLFLDDFCYYMANHTNLAMLRGKFLEMATFLSGSQGVNALGKRPGLLKGAFSLFFSSPIWGNARIVHGIARFELDSHSTVMELASLTGVLGLLFYFYSNLKTFKKLTETFREFKCDLGMYGMSFLFYAVLSFANPTLLVTEISYTLFLYIPLGIWLFSSSKYNAEGKKPGNGNTKKTVGN